MSVAGLEAGTYSGTWWDTFGTGAISNFTFTVVSNNAPVTLATPPILRSIALYVGVPAQAAIVPPNLNQFTVSNSPSFNLPLTITNSGGLPLAYSLSFTSAVPAWLSFSSTNGYVSKSGTQTIYLAFNPGSLAAGTYRFNLIANTSDPRLPVTPLSISFTILSTIPAPPELRVLSTASSQFVFQLLGITNVPYCVQTSTNLTAWVSTSTNALPAGTLNITNPINPGSSAQFWRACWQP